MKLLIGVFSILSFSSGIWANECHVISKLEKAKSVIVKVDGGSLVARFKALSESTTSISVLSSPSTEYVPFFRGDFNYSVKKILGQNFCFLKRKGPVLNTLAIHESEGSSRIYIGLGSIEILKEAIEFDDYVTYEYK